MSSVLKQVQNQRLPGQTYGATHGNNGNNSNNEGRENTEEREADGGWCWECCDRRCGSSRNG